MIAQRRGVVTLLVNVHYFKRRRQAGNITRGHPRLDETPPFFHAHTTVFALVVNLATIVCPAKHFCPLIVVPDLERQLVTQASNQRGKNTPTERRDLGITESQRQRVPLIFLFLRLAQAGVSGRVVQRKIRPLVRVRRYDL